MLGVQRLTTARRWGRLFACGLGYLLVLQGLMAGIGLGMSASASEQATFAICTRHHAAGLQSRDDQQKSEHHLQCAFCLAAMQSCRHLAGTAVATVHTGYGKTRLLGVFHVARNSEVSGFCSRRTSGDPRGPPQFSV